VLTEEQVAAELCRVIPEVGGFPTVTTLLELGRGDLLAQIQKTGGQNHYRRLLGFRLLASPNNYWTLERTLAALNVQYKELGRLPRQKEMKRGLANAVAKHGGLKVCAEKLGLAVAKKPNGWWKDAEVLLDTLRNDVIAILGHFPTSRELRELGRHDLANAISRGGGFPYCRALWEEMAKSQTEVKKGKWNEL